MNELTLPKVPSLVDGAELDQPPAEVSKFAPARHRQPTTLGQTVSDMRRVINEAQRAHEEYARAMKQHWDELLRIIG